MNSGTPDSVKRYVLSLKDGVREYRPHHYYPATTSVPMVAASDYDSLHSRLVAAEQENAALKARVGELERENQALRNLANNLQPGPISEALAGTRYTRESELLARAEAAERLREAIDETCDYLSTLVPSAASDDMATALTAVVIDLRAALARLREEKPK